ncbi:hypothetical protein SEA_CECE_292 [Microbacterium phage Cece]|nr:hypothetical protein SEA_CECE_292 [Microbacterium phage Cece]
MGFRRGFRPRRRLTWETVAAEIRAESEYIAGWDRDDPMYAAIALAFADLANRLEGKAHD